MAPEAKKTLKYGRFHRYWNSVLTLCMILTVISGIMNSVSVSSILWRCFIVFFCLSLLEMILVRGWVTWESLQQTDKKR